MEGGLFLTSVTASSYAPLTRPWTEAGRRDRRLRDPHYDMKAVSRTYFGGKVPNLRKRFVIEKRARFLISAADTFGALAAAVA